MAKKAAKKVAKKKAAKKAKKAAAGYPIKPGQSRTFLYVGEFIPNVVGVQNLGAAAVRFTLTSNPPGWRYWGRVAGNRTVALSVEFPNGKLTFHNEGPSVIEINGEGIRP